MKFLFIIIISMPLWAFQFIQDSVSDGSVIDESRNLKSHKSISLVKQGENWALLNSSGALVVGDLKVRPEVKNHLTFFRQAQLWGAVNNESAAIILPSIYRSIKIFGPNLLMVYKGGQWFPVDFNGKFLLKQGYDLIHTLSPALIAVHNSQGWGLIDRQGRVIHQNFAEEFSAASSGMIRFKDKGKFGYMSDLGKIQVKASFDQATSFDESGTAHVRIANEWLKIDKTGAVLSEVELELDGSPERIVSNALTQQKQDLQKNINIYKRVEVNYREPYYYPYSRAYRRPWPRPYYRGPAYSYGSQRYLSTGLHFYDGKVRGSIGLGQSWRIK